MCWESRLLVMIEVTQLLSCGQMVYFSFKLFSRRSDVLLLHETMIC